MSCILPGGHFQGEGGGGGGGGRGGGGGGGGGARERESMIQIKGGKYHSSLADTSCHSLLFKLQLHVV